MSILIDLAGGAPWSGSDAGVAYFAEKPLDVLAWNSVAEQSGLMTGIAASAPVFSLRNVSAKLIIVRRLGVGFLATTGFTAAQQVGFGLRAARNFSASDSGGTAIALTGSNSKHRTSLGTPTSLDCRIAATVALTAGTRNLDANRMGIQNAWAAAAAQGAIIPTALANLFSHDTGDHPIILGQNEGIIVENLILMAAGGVGILTVNLEFAEADSF